MNGKVFGVPVVLIVLVLVLLGPVLFVDGVIIHKLDSLNVSPVKTVVVSQPQEASVSATLTPTVSPVVKERAVVGSRSGVLK